MKTAVTFDQFQEGVRLDAVDDYSKELVPRIRFLGGYAFDLISVTPVNDRLAVIFQTSMGPAIVYCLPTAVSFRAIHSAAV